MTKTIPIAVNFHDPDEFMTEIRFDKDRIDRGILRITVRRRYGNPFVTVSVVAMARKYQPAGWFICDSSSARRCQAGRDARSCATVTAAVAGRARVPRVAATRR